MKPSMHDKHLYEYAVIRYVPRVEREEFINVGLIMMCKRQRWLKVMTAPDHKRIEAFDGSLDHDTLMKQLRAFDIIATGHHDGGTIAALEVTERFRWLTAVRSACIQTSRPHPGITDDLDATFTRLFNDLVS